MVKIEEMVESNFQYNLSGRSNPIISKSILILWNKRKYRKSSIVQMIKTEFPFAVQNPEVMRGLRLSSHLRALPWKSDAHTQALNKISKLVFEVQEFVFFFQIEIPYCTTNKNKVFIQRKGMYLV